MPAPLYVLPNGGGWAYGGFHLDRTSLDYLAALAARAARPAHARRGVGHAVGRAARPRGARRRDFVQLATAALPRETDEQLTQRVLGYLTARGGGTSTPASGRRARPRSRSSCATGSPARRRPSQKSAWFGDAARRVADAADADVAARVSGSRRSRSRACRWPKPTTRRWRWSWPCARCRTGTAILDAQLGRIDEPRSQGALPVRHAGAVGRSGRARALVHGAQRRQQPPARAVGARGARLPASSAARAGVGEVRRARASSCCGRSRRPATSSSRSAGWTRRSAATRTPPSPPRCADFSTRCRRVTPIG